MFSGLSQKQSKTFKNFFTGWSSGLLPTRNDVIGSRRRSAGLESDEEENGNVCSRQIKDES